eukprot:CFRG7003T1
MKNIKPSLPKGGIFTKDLQDLIRGLRQAKGTEAAYIAECLKDITEELRSDSNSVKTKAISKLSYLHMLGYDTSFAAFKTVEVMSQSKFSYKRVGYLMASQTFRDDTDVLMLTTNLIKKDMMSPNQYEAGLALTALSVFVTPDLARDLANDVITLFSSSRPYIRKKSILAMYKIFLRFPDSLRPAFPRLRERLDDPDLSVQCAAVNVICELARKNPKSYLSLAPTLYKLLGASNNWMLIKIIKLFAALMPLEPRLAKKLMEPLSNIIHTTNAMSLLYETISAAISGMSDHTTMMQLCVTKLKVFVEDSDQNLKFLGLLQLGRVSEMHPRLVMDCKDVVMVCLDDEDETIRMRAMDLLVNMVSKKSLPDIVKRIMTTLDNMSSRNRDTLIDKMILMCSQDNYKYIADFEWYLTVILSLVSVENSTSGEAVCHQILDVCVRVKEVRPYAVSLLSPFVRAPFDGYKASPPVAKEGNMVLAVHAAAWVVGEYSEYLTSAKETIGWLLQEQTLSLPPAIQAVCVHNALKIFARIIAPAPPSSASTATSTACSTSQGIQAHWQIPHHMFVVDMLSKLEKFEGSSDMEVQERTCLTREVLNLYIEVCGGFDNHRDDETVFEPVCTMSPGEMDIIMGSPIADGFTTPTEGMPTPNSTDEPPDISLVGEGVDVHMATHGFGNTGTSMKDSEMDENVRPNEGVGSDGQGIDGTNRTHCKDRDVSDSAVEGENDINIQYNEQQELAVQLLQSLFHDDLNPVAATAQSKVPVPENINLDKWIHTRPSSSEEEVSSDDEYNDVNSQSAYGSAYEGRSGYNGGGGNGGRGFSGAGYKSRVEDPVEVEKRLEARRIQNQNNPHYLGGTAGGGSNEKTGFSSYNNHKNMLSMAPADVESIPIETLDLGRTIELGLQDEYSHKTHQSRRKKGKKDKHAMGSMSNVNPTGPVKSYTIQQVEDFPDNLASSKTNGKKPESGNRRNGASSLASEVNEDDPHSLLAIDLDQPLTEKDTLPVNTHRTNVTSEPTNTPIPTLRSSPGSHTHRRKSKQSRARGRTDRETDEARFERPDPQTGGEGGVFESRSKHKHTKKHARDNDVPLKTSVNTDAQSRGERKIKLKEKRKKSRKGDSTSSSHKHKHEHKHTNTNMGTLSLQEPLLSSPSDNLIAFNTTSSDATVGESLADLHSLVDIETMAVGCTVGYSGDGSLLYLTFALTNKTKETNWNGVSLDLSPLPDTLQSICTSAATSIVANCTRRVRHDFRLCKPLCPLQLQGTLRYSKADSEDIEKVSFQLQLPISVFVLPITIEQNTLSDILSDPDSGLSMGESCVLSASIGFSSVVEMIVIAGHFAVVEKSDTHCSAYGRTLQNDHICLLMSYNAEDSTVELTCKATISSKSKSLATFVLEELELLF